MTKTIKRKLKKLSDGIITETPIEIRCLKHGRPKRGRATFKWVILKDLPDLGRQSDVAKVLGVRLASVQQWCELKKNPLPFIIENNRRMLEKEIVIKWLIATRRCRGKKKR
jgi:hypothetical protein